MKPDAKVIALPQETASDKREYVGSDNEASVAEVRRKCLAQANEMLDSKLEPNQRIRLIAVISRFPSDPDHDVDAGDETMSELENWIAHVKASIGRGPAEDDDEMGTGSSDRFT